jgi:hypothetical protein
MCRPTRGVALGEEGDMRGRGSLEISCTGDWLRWPESCLCVMEGLLVSGAEVETLFVNTAGYVFFFFLERGVIA